VQVSGTWALAGRIGHRRNNVWNPKHKNVLTANIVYVNIVKVRGCCEHPLTVQSLLDFHNRGNELKMGPSCGNQTDDDHRDPVPASFPISHGTPPLGFRTNGVMGAPPLATVASIGGARNLAPFGNVTIINLYLLSCLTQLSVSIQVQLDCPCIRII
jgi:hypothetical protein